MNERSFWLLLSCPWLLSALFRVYAAQEQKTTNNERQTRHI